MSTVTFTAAIGFAAVSPLASASLLAEALRECRASGGTHASCKAEARARYHDDVAHAKDYLAPRRQLA